VQAEHLRSLPDYDKGNLTPEVERRICNTLGRSNETMSSTNIEQHHPDFYKHDYFNDDNLYKHRLHEAQKVKKESEYDSGLKLWEKRSEGGVIPDRSGNREGYREREIEEDARMEMVRNRRNAYQQRRGGGTGRDSYRSRDNSIEGRITDEGLQDA
jgi:hypothetical protein